MIYIKFVKSGKINIPAPQKVALDQKFAQGKLSLADFKDSFSEIVGLLKADTFPRFVNQSKLNVS